MPQRPYATKYTADLAELYKNNLDNPKVLKDILKELNHRTRGKAKKLAKQIENHLVATGNKINDDNPGQPPLPIGNPVPVIDTALGSNKVAPDAKRKSNIDLEKKIPPDH